MEETKIGEIKKEEEWKEKSNENLKKRKSSLRVIDIKYLFAVIVILILFSTALFSYFTINHYFSSTFVDNSTCTNSCPTIPACPAPIINVNFTIPSNLNINCTNNNLNNTNSSG